MKVVRMVYEVFCKDAGQHEGGIQRMVACSTVMVVENDERGTAALQGDLNAAINDESFLERVEVLFIAELPKEEALPLVEAFLSQYVEKEMV